MRTSPRAAWLILELTHSPVAVGLLMPQFLPATVLGLFSGVLVDRLDVAKTVIATQAASMVFAAALAAVTLGGIVEAWMVYLLTGLRGIWPGRRPPGAPGLAFQLVGRDRLRNAVGAQLRGLRLSACSARAGRAGHRRGPAGTMLLPAGVAVRLGRRAGRRCA